MSLAAAQSFYDVTFVSSANVMQEKKNNEVYSGV